MKWQRFKAFCQQGVRFDRACCVACAPLFDGDERYDLQDDPHELHNGIGDPGHAAVCNDLRQRLLLALRHG